MKENDMYEGKSNSKWNVVEFGLGSGKIVDFKDVFTTKIGPYKVVKPIASKLLTSQAVDY